MGRCRRRRHYKAVFTERIHRVRNSTGLYRSRNGIVLGVCKGLAEYFDIRVGLVRAAAIVGFIFTGFWPVGIIYLALGLILKPEPVVELRDLEDADFYNSYTNNRTAAVDRLKRRFGSLDRRLQRLEDVVTSKDYDWDRRARGRGPEPGRA